MKTKDWPYFRTRLHPEVQKAMQVLAAETGKSSTRIINETMAERLGVEIDWVAEKLAGGSRESKK